MCAPAIVIVVIPLVVDPWPKDATPPSKPCVTVEGEPAPPRKVRRVKPRALAPRVLRPTGSDDR